MRLPFRNWLQEQLLDHDSRSLYDEAILSYQVGANRGALLLSYLAFLRTIAGRLMQASKPTCIPERLWESIQGGLRNDLQWERQAFDALSRTQPISIFLIDDEIRQQLEYWRGRRNDVAHSRGNEIGQAHVEAFWMFVRSNLSKFVVNGGREGLLERFRRHFDPGQTPPDQDSTHLVAEISSAVRPQERRDFFRSLVEATGAFGDIDIAQMDYRIASKGKALLDSVSRVNDAVLIENLAEEMRARPDLLVACLLARPQLVHWFGEDRSLIRSLWHDLLPLEASIYHAPLSASLRVVAAMLRNGLIPQDQQAETIERVVDKLKECYPLHGGGYSEELLRELAPFGFFEAVYQAAFVKFNHVEWAARNIALVFEYLSRKPLTEQMAATFCGFFPTETSGDYPWIGNRFGVPEIVSNLRMAFYREQPEKLKELVRIARASNLQSGGFERAMSFRDDSPE